MIKYREEWTSMSEATLIHQMMSLSEGEISLLPDMTGCPSPKNGTVYTPEEMYHVSAQIGDQYHFIKLCVDKGWLLTVPVDNGDEEEG